MKPKTLEEAIAAIEQLTAQVTDITGQRDAALADKKKILDEKKDLLKMFDEKDKEGMTETEKKLAETLEAERAERIKLQDQIKADNDKRNSDENARISKALEDRITKVAKGDTKVAEQLRANVALLEKMPRSSDGELDAVVTAGFNMLGSKDASPLAAINNGAGGAPIIDAKPAFSDTDAGKSMAGKLGLTAVAKPAEGGDKK